MARENEMVRIQGTDSMVDILIKMTEGNPGALAALTSILQSTVEIDPNDFMGGLGPILLLDTLGIYGTDIYVLWSDICDQDTVKIITVLRACQLGYISNEIIKDATSRQDRTGRDLINLEDLYAKVCDFLPAFDKANRK